MVILLILLLILLRQLLRDFGGDFTFALILLTMFFVKLSINRSTTETIDDFSNIHKSCHPRHHRINSYSNYKFDSDDEEYNYYNEQNKYYTALEYQCLEIKRSILEHEFFFQRLWTYTILVLFFFVCAVCVPYAVVYSWKEYHRPEQVSGQEHNIMEFIVAAAVIAVAAHQV